jgi:hypothetical protein
MRRYLPFIGALGLGCILGPSLTAQQAERRDTLERRLATLEAEIDSLRRLVGQRAAGRGDTAQAAGELAALRARARALAPEARADTEPEFALRSRTLNQLNPEVSATADVRARAFRPGPQRSNVEIREFTISLQAPLDPYANTKIFASFGEHVEIEEGYAYWTGLPGGIRLDVGRFRQQAGELNRWHLHALPGAEFPRVITEYFGHHGLVANGVSLYATLPVTSPGGGVHEVWGQASLADNDVLFGAGAAALSALGHLNNFWQLSRSAYMQVGGTVLYGENPDSSVATRVFGADVRLTWRPPERALYRSFTVRGEGFAVRRRVAGGGDTRYGGYAGAELQLSRRLYVGGRFDAVQLLDGVTDLWQTNGYLTWWQSEWVFGRLEWQHEAASVPSGARDHADRLVLQLVWSVGPHKHEAY